VVDYLARLFLSPLRWAFVRHHILDLFVVAVPIFRPLQAVRLLRVLNLARAGVLLTNGQKRTKQVLTHHGLH
jgi:hypothetical protein